MRFNLPRSENRLILHHNCRRLHYSKALLHKEEEDHGPNQHPHYDHPLLHSMFSHRLRIEDRNFKALFQGGRGVEIRAGGGKKDQNGGIRSFRHHKRPYRKTIPVCPQVHHNSE